MLAAATAPLPPQTGRPSPRRLGPPLAVGSAVAAVFLALWAVLVFLEDRHLERLIALKAQAVGSNIAEVIARDVKTLERMALRWQSGGRPSDWERDARNYVRDLEGLAALIWLDSELAQRAAVARAQYDVAFGTDLLADQALRTAIELARHGPSARYLGPARLPGGAAGFLILAPLHRGRDLPGAIVAAFRLRDFLQGLFPRAPDGVAFSISASGREDSARIGREPEQGARHVHVFELSLYEQDWSIRAWPTQDLLDTVLSPAPEIALGLGLLLATVSGFLVHAARTSQSQARELTAANAALQEEIEARQRAEERIRCFMGRLRRSNEELAQFASVASHDLQEPLRVVSSYCQLLKRRFGGVLGKDGDEFIGFAVDAAERMRALINDLLTYSRVEAEGTAFERTDIGAMCQTVFSNLKTLIEETDARISCEALPTILADPVQMTQLLQNLIGNAIKYRRDVRPEIRVRAERADADWTFSVSDNGIGIAPEYRERIFRIFQRLHSRRSYAGTGIGLAICEKIVRRHGGRIWVESTPGEGSTFFFTIPVRRAGP